MLNESFRHQFQTKKINHTTAVQKKTKAICNWDLILERVFGGTIVTDGTSG